MCSLRQTLSRSVPYHSQYTPCYARLKYSNRASHHCKHPAARGSLLTLPSRGRFPAYGLQAPLMSNVGRHKEHVSECHASRHCSQSVKAASSLRVCIGCAARKSYALASFQDRAARLCSGRQGRWQLERTSHLCASESTSELASSPISAGACAPTSANVGQSVGAAAS